jgi:hypothetical protein
MVMDSEVEFATMIVALLAAVLGLWGSVVLYRSSVATIQFPFYADHDLIERVTATNKRLKKRQGLGFGLLCVSFVFQMLAALMPAAPLLTAFVGAR